jgi:tetratricopeptide (TPR) repeat protein
VLALLLAVGACLVAGSASAEPRRNTVTQQYERGVRYFEARDYDRAIAEFSRAYEESHAPELLFNLAQCYRAKGRGSCTEAVRLYKQYLDEVNNPPNRQAVEAYIADRQACAAEEAEEAQTRSVQDESSRSSPAGPVQTPSAPSLAPATEAKGWGGRRTAGWSVLGVGAVGLLAAGITGALALRDESQLGSACTAQGDCPISVRNQISRYDAERWFTVGAGAVGVAGLAGGLYLLWTSRPNEPARQATLAPWIGRAVVGVQGHF